MEFVGKQLSQHLLKCHRDYLKLEYVVGAGSKGSLRQFGWKFTPVETLSASPRLSACCLQGQRQNCWTKTVRLSTHLNLCLSSVQKKKTAPRLPRVLP